MNLKRIIATGSAAFFLSSPYLPEVSAYEMLQASQSSNPAITQKPVEQPRKPLNWDECEPYIKKYFSKTSEQSAVPINESLEKIFDYTAKGYRVQDGLTISLQGDMHLIEGNLEFRVTRSEDFIYIAIMMGQVPTLTFMNFKYDPSTGNVVRFDADFHKVDAKLPGGWLGIYGTLPTSAENVLAKILNHLVRILESYKIK